MGAKRRVDPEELLPLTPVALKMRLGPGTLYGSLKRMVDGGLVEESEGRAEDETDDGRGGYDAGRRRYYRLTGFGERVLAAELARLEGVVRTAQAKGVFPPGSPGRGVSSPGEA